jgi:hypothetical protein
MPTTSTTPPSTAPRRLPATKDRASQTVRERLGAIASAVVAAILGVLPHVLHHVGPLAGAALLAGAAGTLLFGVVGLAASIPFLLRVHRRCGNWRVPTVLLATFAATFSISAFVIGPAISDNDSNGKPAPATQTEPGAPAKAGHDAHH